jgi:hypothetical protein
LREPIGTEPARLVLSAEEERLLGEVLGVLPAEAAEVYAAVTRLLFDVLGVFQGRLVTPLDVDRTLAWLTDVFLSLSTEDDARADHTGILALFTRHAMVQARGAILHDLAWARRN